MPVIWIGPVSMLMGHGFMLVPVTVIYSPRHSWEYVVVMAVVMAMPMLVCRGVMMMHVRMLLEEQKRKGSNDNQ